MHQDPNRGGEVADRIIVDLWIRNKYIDSTESVNKRFRGFDMPRIEEARGGGSMTSWGTARI